jgi:hypothetical protein
MLLRNSGSTINLERRPELHQRVQAVAVGYPTNRPNPLPAHAFWKIPKKKPDYREFSKHCECRVGLFYLFT